MLLGEAMAGTIGLLELDEDLAEQQEALEDVMPRSATLFDVAGVKTQLATLHTAAEQPELYQPTDYHWLLLYEALESYCVEFNEVPHGVLSDDYGITRLDFDRLIDVFFWDTDFLDVHIPLMSLDARQFMNISPETFGVTAGMKSHPEELVLEVCDEELVREFEEDPCVLYLPGSKEYPSLSDAHAN
jgi:hypothetical protein